MSPQLAANLSNAWKMASNYLWVATGAAYGVFLSLPLDQQATVIAHLPVPAWAVPVIGSVIGIVSRVWPQKSIGTAAKP